MKVLFLGQTGIDKRPCVERLAQQCLRHNDLPADLEHTKAMKHIRVFHLEDQIREQIRGDYISYLDQFFLSRQQSEWNAAWDSVIAEAEASGSEHTFISLHASYFRKNRFFTVVSPDRIRDFEPDFIITLIDDAHECWARIRLRESKNPRGTNVRLRDVFLWRTVETMAGDLLSHSGVIPHYVVATKHPAEMVRRLVFDGERLRVYASFPISRTRGQASDRGLVDGFRLRLHRDFTVFDPLTIDERVIKTAFEDSPEAATEARIEYDLRWALDFEDGFEALVEGYEQLYPIDIPVEQIREVIDDIDPQIVGRDFRLVDQAQTVAAFRPSFRGHPSQGVSAELQYAAQTAGIPVHLVWDDDEDGAYAASPFTVGGTRHDDVEALVASIN